LVCEFELDHKNISLPLRGLPIHAERVIVEY
jgi:hypothetical protein